MFVVEQACGRLILSEKYLNVVPIREIYDRWINQYASPSVELLSKLKHDLEVN